MIKPSAPTSPLHQELQEARAAAREAGALVRSYYQAWHRSGDAHGALAVQLKDGDEPVTEADKAASALIVARLRAAFPDDVILSEEAPDDGARHRGGRLWVVDPIDGTKDFIAGRPGFSVMIGLLIEGQPALGVVYQPLRQIVGQPADRLWEGVRGHGAYEVLGDERRRLSVSTIADLTQVRMVSSASRPEATVAQLREAAGIKDEQNIGSVGIKLGLIAAGERDLYLNPATTVKLWDTCAPQVLLHEAGGLLTDCHGDALCYTGALGHLRGLLASNRVVHAAAIQRLQPLLPPALRR